jgi:type I restriction-modification system DNA methylase subunit
LGPGLSKSKRDSQKASENTNYSLFNQKITFEFLKSHLWSAADILRGSLDPSDYRQPIMTILFLKRLNDTFEENAEKLIKQGKSQKVGVSLSSCMPLGAQNVYDNKAYLQSRRSLMQRNIYLLVNKN